MIAADTSSLSAFFAGEEDTDARLIQIALTARDIALPPVVVSEMLSDPFAQKEMLQTVTEFPLLPILDGYWERAGQSRRILKTKNLKAKIADTLIAQSCIDHDIALITRDSDFRHFAEHCGLKLA
ncbi:MAG TPA: PIN domain-containing protein [Rhizomicrobium sp.]|jgi:predicted nucleic acid-binding protein|nr:PIN domain-containing protein [Rhizomicrobium sp.]